MKKMIFRVAIIGMIVILSGCATTSNPVPIPEEVLALKPQEQCDHEPQADAWDMRAQLFDDGNNAFLVIHFDPGFTMLREPSVQLRAGFAIFEQEQNHNYIYRLGKLPKSRKIATVAFQTPVPVRYKGETHNQIIQLELERREDQNCLKIIAKN